MAVYTEETINKLSEFFKSYMSDPKQCVLTLCRKLKLSNSTLYLFCREHNLKLNDIRNGKQDHTKKINQILAIDVAQNENKPIKEEDKKEEDKEDINRISGGTLTKEYMENIVTKVHAFTNKGYTVEEALKKAKINLHFSTFYTYRRKLASMKKSSTKVKKEKTEIKKPKSDINSEMPTVPHIIEYVVQNEKEDTKKENTQDVKNQNEAIMLIGDPDTLFTLYQKIKGNKE